MIPNVTRSGGFSMIQSLSPEHPDVRKWNRKYSEKLPDFQPHSIVMDLSLSDCPAGRFLEVAGGPSGTALALASEYNRHVEVVDASDVALGLLWDEACRRELSSLVSCVQMDLTDWTPRKAYALVLGLRFWDRNLFARLCSFVVPGGVMAWETFTLREQKHRPRFRSEWCLQEGEPLSLLPDDFVVLALDDIEATNASTRRLIAQRKVL